MNLKKAIKKYIELANYREKFFDSSINYKKATHEMKYLEEVILEKINKEDKTNE